MCARAQAASYLQRPPCAHLCPRVIWGAASETEQNNHSAMPAPPPFPARKLLLALTDELSAAHGRGRACALTAPPLRGRRAHRRRPPRSRAAAHAPEVDLAQQRAVTMYITLHYITLHYIALHCVALHCIALLTPRWISRSSVP